MRARLLVFLAAAGLAALLAGCGGITAPDLFIVYRSGDGPGAHLTLIVNEEGGVRCNGKQAKQKLSDPQIIKARTIQEDLEKPAAEHTSLPARPGSVLSYYVRDEKGSVRFSDNSSAQPAVFRQMALFVLEASQQVCHLAE
jgi:hypothetical protein